MFKDAKHAVRWAETRLSRSPVKNTLAPLMKAAQVGAGDMSAEELDDLALTVTNMCSAINPPKGVALMAVYGLSSPQRDISLADAMVMHNKMQLTGADLFETDAMHHLSDQQHANLMRCVITDESLTSLGLRPLPKSRVYEVTALNHYKYNKYGIAALYRISQSMLRQWIDDAARQLEAQLDAIGVLD